MCIRCHLLLPHIASCVSDRSKVKASAIRSRRFSILHPKEGFEYCNKIINTVNKMTTTNVSVKITLFSSQWTDWNRFSQKETSDIFSFDLRVVVSGRITSLQLQTHLTSLCITNRDVSNLLRLMEADVAVCEVKELVTPLVKQAKWCKIVNQAVHELEAVYRNAKALGCDVSVLQTQVVAVDLLVKESSSREVVPSYLITAKQ